MTTEIRVQAQRRDRWVSWIVIAVFVIALAGGWVVKVVAEGRTQEYNQGGFQVRYPDGWVKADVEPPVVLRVVDKLAAPFPSSLILESRPMPQAEKPAAGVQQDLAMERGRNWYAFRVLEKEEAVTIAGRTAMHTTFAYVETNPNPFLETVPVVMLGEDYIFSGQDRVYVVTLTAAEGNYEQVKGALQSFMSSLQVP